MFTNRLFMLSIAIVLLVSACAPKPTTVSPSFQRWQTTDAVQAFHAVGLPIEILELSKDERDLFSNQVGQQSIQFVVPNQGDPDLARGIIFSFEKEIDLQQVLDYYIAIDQSLPQYASWLFVKDNLLLQINRNIPEEVAKQYAEALNLLDQ
jgi:hypothetical protein